VNISWPKLRSEKFEEKENNSTKEVKQKKKKRGTKALKRYAVQTFSDHCENGGPVVCSNTDRGSCGEVTSIRRWVCLLETEIQKWGTNLVSTV